MATVQALRKDTTPPPRSPEREALAVAIAKRIEAEQRLAKIAAALDQASASGSEAFRAVKAAKAALEEAKEQASHNLIATALNDTAIGISPAEAQTKLEAARANDEAAGKLISALRSEHASAEQSLRWATENVTAAVAEALRTSSEIQRELNDFEVAKTAMLAAAAKLVALKRVGAINRIAGFNGFEFLPEPAADATWSTTIASLARDADAALPE